MGTLLSGISNSGGKVDAPNDTWMNNSRDAQEFGLDTARSIRSNTDSYASSLKDAEAYATAASRAGYGQVQDYQDWIANQRGLYDTQTQTALDDARNFNDADYRERYAQQAGEQVSGQVANANRNLQREYAARGIGAGSGSYLAALNNNQITGALSTASAQNMAREAARLEGLRLTDRASGMVSQGASTFGPLGLTAATTGASMAAAPLTYQTAALGAVNSGYQAAGGLALGAGNLAVGSYGAQNAFNTANAAANEARLKREDQWVKDSNEQARKWMGYQN